jgi:acyl-coenzyme A thioesterase PaaI-like protein
MDISQVPFNQLIGLEAVADGEQLAALPSAPQYRNHLGTVHAGALLAVAEAGSAACLLRELGDQQGFVPVVRRLEAKFRKPATGRVAARSLAAAEDVARWTTELAARGRVLAKVPIEVVDDEGVVVMSAQVEWFIARGETATS